MATNNFLPINFNPGQVLDESTLDQMNNNMVWLRDQMVDGKVQTGAAVADVGVKILAGKQSIAVTGNTRNWATQTVTFPSMFTAQTNPIITCTVQVPTNQHQVVCSIRNIDGTAADPDHRGFLAIIFDPRGVNMPTTGTYYVHWVAVGI